MKNPSISFLSYSFRSSLTSFSEYLFSSDIIFSDWYKEALVFPFLFWIYDVASSLIILYHLNCLHFRYISSNSDIRRPINSSVCDLVSIFWIYFEIEIRNLLIYNKIWFFYFGSYLRINIHIEKYILKKYFFLQFPLLFRVDFDYFIINFIEKFDQKILNIVIYRTAYWFYKRFIDLFRIAELIVGIQYFKTNYLHSI
jgi:hypothetical protein